MLESSDCAAFSLMGVIIYLLAMLPIICEFCVWLAERKVPSNSLLALDCVPRSCWC